MEELALTLIHEYYQTHVEFLHTEEFEQELVDEVVELVQATLGSAEREPVLEALDLYRFYAPCRTSMWAPPQAAVDEIIKNLIAAPQLAQRSPEWYAFRHGLITASNIYKTFGSPAKQNELVCEKCAPLALHTPAVEGPRHWGVRYEPVSILYYEHINKTKVQEFGCIAHPVHSFIGASPDGINVLETSPLYGRMLEIKNPFSRTITGEPKEEYWVQTQLQMEVCDLNSCDFLETQFVEYEGRAAFYADGTFTETEMQKPKGIILSVLKEGAARYEYAPFQCTEEEFALWEEQILLNSEWINTIYWKLEAVSCSVIERNRAWFESKLPAIARVWGVIVEERETGKWVERLPKKRAAAKPSLVVNKLSDETWGDVHCMEEHLATCGAVVDV